MIARVGRVQTKQEDDREILERMAKAWVNVALADDDVAREALLSPSGDFIPDESRSQWPTAKPCYSARADAAMRSLLGNEGGLLSFL